MTRPRRILLLTYNFPPDLSAGSFRTEALVRALVASGEDVELDVVTSMPNRYRSAGNTPAPVQEAAGPVTIRRVELPPPGRGRASQVRRFARFAWAVSQHTAGRHYDVVFATSSRLMTAALGAWVSRRRGSPLYLDIRDIFVETMLDLSRGSLSGRLLHMLDPLERWTVGRADRVNVVSGGFVPYFRERYGDDLALDVFTNGIDEAFIGDFSPRLPAGGDELNVVYAGNVGDGQGLHLILPELAERTAGRARFRIVGDGGRIEALREAVQRSGVTNVRLEPPVPRARVVDIYREADVLFLHLNNVPAFERVIPSKPFEYAATGKPILAGVSGFSARFIKDEIANAHVFRPCDAAGAAEALGRLERGITPRDAFLRTYDRKRIMTAMAQRVLALAGAGRGAS